MPHPTISAVNSAVGFNALPLELQHMIWSYLITPRLLTFNETGTSLTILPSSSRHTPTILHINASSRSYALRKYTLLPLSPPSTASFYINPHLDIWFPLPYQLNIGPKAEGYYHLALPPSLRPHLRHILITETVAHVVALASSSVDALFSLGGIVRAAYERELLALRTVSVIMDSEDDDGTRRCLENGGELEVASEELREDYHDDWDLTAEIDLVFGKAVAFRVLKPVGDNGQLYLRHLDNVRRERELVGL